MADDDTKQFTGGPPVNVPGKPNGTAHAGDSTPDVPAASGVVPATTVVINGGANIAPSQPAPAASVSGQDQAAAIIVDFETILSKIPLRQVFDWKTIQFWAMIGSVAAVIMAWINVDSALSVAVQTAITVIGGVVIASVTGAAVTKTPVASVVASLNKAGINLSQTDAPTRFGYVSPVGGYSYGYVDGSVVTGGADAPVAPSKGGSTGQGGVPLGTTDEGNVLPSGGSVGTQQGAFTPGTGAESNLAPGVEPGNNSAEGTGGPAVGTQSGPYDQTAHTEAPGSYTPPTPSVANPDEASPHIFKSEKPKLTTEELEAQRAKEVAERLEKTRAVRRARDKARKLSADLANAQREQEDAESALKE